MNTEVRSASTQDDVEEIDLRQLLGTLIDHKWWIVAITAVFAIAASAYALFATPIYRADAIVQVESKMPSLPGLTDLSDSLGIGGGAGVSTTEIALIKSRSVVGSAAEQLHLDIEVMPRRFPIVGTYVARRWRDAEPDQLSPSLMGLSSFAWGGEILQISKLDVPYRLVERKLTLVALGDGNFEILNDDAEQLAKGKVGEVVRSAGGSVIRVERLRANAGTRFSVVKRKSISVVNELQERISVNEIGKESGILALGIEDKDADLAQAFLQRVAEAYVRQNVDRNSAEASAQLTFVKQQLPSIRGQVDAAQAALSAYQMRANSVDLSLQTKGLLEQEVAVETSIQQLRLQQADMDRKFTKDHPAYRALLRQIGELEGRKNDFQGQVKQLPEAQQELLRLTRDLQVSNEMYTVMLNQAQQLEVARAGTVGNVRIVDNAEADATDPVKPNKAAIILVGIFLGLALSMGVVYARRILNRGVEDPSQIEELGLPVYASVPASNAQLSDSVRGAFKADGKVHLLAMKDPADLAVEAIRSLRTSLHFARLEAKNNIVLISGSSPNAGKTFVSSNLAAVIAQAGQRVLVVDADMRKGTLHKALGAKQSPGLSDVLVGRATLVEAIGAVDGLENLHYVTRGGIPPNPSELLMHENFTKFLEQAERSYDLVLIDTPPILAVTDAAVIAHHAGTCLLVARFGLNQPRELALAKKRFEQNGVKLKGAIFNAVERRAAGYYSYGYYEYKSAS